MRTGSEVLKESALRFVVIGGLAVILSFILFGPLAFNPFMTSFEYVASGVTIAIAYAAFKSERVRNGLAAELIWYVFLMTIIGYSNGWWNYVMEASYIIGLVAAVYLYFMLINKRIVKGLIQRAVAVIIIVAVAHALIVIFLQLVNSGIFVHPLRSLGWSLMNLRNGTVIGIISAIGMEFSEYLINLPLFRPKVAE